ncbi:MAG: TetR/AcrR family transcriptional regulator [Raineya sp.]
MGISERKKREKDAVKAKILETANRLFLEKGYEGTSIRTISEAIEYSPATIYLYFKDKNDIFLQLQKQAFELLEEKMKATQSIVSPLERLKEMGKVYLNFAFDNPQYYDLMFILRSPMQGITEKNTWQEGIRLYQSIETVVEACIVAKQIKGTEHQVIAFTIWSYIHGQCALLIRQRLPMHEKQHLRYLISSSFEFFWKILETPSIG